MDQKNDKKGNLNFRPQGVSRFRAILTRSYVVCGCIIYRMATHRLRWAIEIQQGNGINVCEKQNIFPIGFEFELPPTIA